MSTTTIAQLVVQMTADIAKFSTDMRSVSATTERAMSSIQSAATAAKGALGALGIGLGVAEFAAYAKSTISAAAALDDFAESTGSSVESLSQLTNQAKVAGVPFDTLQTAINKLAAGMNGVDDESTKIGRALAQLGITAKDPSEAFRQIALTMDKYADGTGKAAAMADLFGKNWAAVMPALKAVVEEQDVQATVTTRQAAEAEALEKNWQRLAVQAGVLKTVLLSDLVPAMNAVIDGFRAAQREGMGWLDTLAVGFAARNPDKSIASLSDSIGRMKDRIAEWESRPNGGRSWWDGPQWLAGMKESLASSEQQMRVLIALRDQLIQRNVASMGFTGDARDLKLGNFGAKPELDYKAAGADAKAAKQAIADYADEIQRLNDTMFKSSGAGGGWDNLLRANEKLQADVRAGKAINTEQARLFIQTAIAADQEAQAHAALKAQIDEATKAREAEIAAMEKNAEAATKALGDFYEGNRALQQEIELIGADDLARRNAVTTKEYEIEKNKLLLAGNTDELAMLEELYQARLKLNAELVSKSAAVDSAKAYADAWAGVIRDVTSGLSNFFVDLANNGKSAFSRLWDSFKNMALRALADIAAKQIVVSVLGAVGLTGASSAMAGVNAVGSSGGGMSFGLSSLGMANPYGQGFSLAQNTWGAGAGFGGSFGAGASAVMGGAGIGAAIGMGTAALFGNGYNNNNMQLAATIGGAIGSVVAGPVGAIVGSLLGSAIGSLDSTGKPQNRYGTWMSTTSGALPRGNTLFQGQSALGGMGIVDDRFFSDADMGASVQAFIKGITEVDNAIANAVGPDVARQMSENIAKVTTDFSAGMEHGAVSFGDIVKQRYTVALDTINTGLGDLIRNFKGTDAELGAFAARVVTVYQALKKIDPATVETLNLTDDAFIALAGASDEVLTTFNALVGAFQYVSTLTDPLAAAMEGLGTDWEKLMRQGNNLSAMAAYFDGSAASAAKLATATNDFYAATVQMLSAIEQIKKSVADLFNSNIRTFTMSGMTNEQQYAYLQQETAGWMRELQTATDPARINWLASSIAQNQSTAWGLLSPEQQAAAKQQFIDGANLANDAVQTRLAAAEQAANDRYQQFLTDVKDVLAEAVAAQVTAAEAAAAKQMAAAETQRAAADTQLAAAETPQVIYVNDQSQGAAATVGSY